MPKIVPLIESIQYDGTNGSYIASTFLNGQVTFVSDNGTTFVFINGERTTFNVSVGSWILRYPLSFSFPDVRTNSDYQACYLELP